MPCAGSHNYWITAGTIFLIVRPKFPTKRPPATAEKLYGFHFQNDVHEPLVSPLYGDSSDLPPITVFTGTHDILNPDAVRFDHGWPVTTYTYQIMDHIFALLPIPEGQDALHRIAQIMQH